MDGSAELMRLAGLLRVGADTIRLIARLRPRDAEMIEEMACQAEAMAMQLDTMVAHDAREVRSN